MSQNFALKAAARDRAGKGIARALRRENRTPAVIYGDKKEPVLISIDSNDINVEYNRGHIFTTLCDLDVAGDKHLVLARDVQLHPVTDIVEHVDFLRVTKKTKIAVNVPVHFINEDQSPGLKEKGILNVTRHTIEVLVTATAIPEQIEVDLAGKDLGDSIKSSDATLPEGAKFVIDDREFTIATLQAPKVAVETDEDEAEEGAEGAEGEGEGEDAASEEAAEE